MKEAFENYREMQPYDYLGAKGFEITYIDSVSISYKHFDNSGVFYRLYSIKIDSINGNESINELLNKSVELPMPKSRLGKRKKFNQDIKDEMNYIKEAMKGISYCLGQPDDNDNFKLMSIYISKIYAGYNKLTLIKDNYKP